MEAIKISKYGEAIGIWDLKVGGANLQLKPKKGDNYKLSTLLNESKKRNDESWLMSQFAIFIKELINRDVPPLNDAEKNELEEYVEFNLLELMKETLVKFRWSTREDMKKLEDQGADALKKSLLQYR